MSKKQTKPDALQSDYIPTPKERAAVQRVVDRDQATSPTPRMKVRDNKISVDHPHRVLGNLLILRALGTADLEFKNGFVELLANAQSPGSEESGLNFSMSVVAGIDPRDQIEALLGAYVAVTHTWIMKAAQRLARADNLPEVESAECSFNKFVRTFVSLTEALKRYRTVSEQNVTVQNLSVRDGGQAIVGNVTQNAPAAPTDKSVSPAAITDARVQPMEIIGKAEREVIPAKPKSNP